MTHPGGSFCRQTSLTLKTGEEVSRPHPLARPGALLLRVLQADGGMDVFCWGVGTLLLLAPVPVFAFEFPGPGHVCDEQGMWHL